MSNFLRKQLSISFFNLLLVAILGVILRYKIAFYLPIVQQKNVLHSHSHFAFAGWITQVLMVLMVHYLSVKTGDYIFKKYRSLLYANCITAYGMLVSFILQGYGFFSIGFTVLSILTSYFFAVYYWKDLNRMNKKNTSHLWFKAALVFSILSSAGAFGLAYMMANNIAHQNWYLAATYFFLHFQYNGWFFFAGMGLLITKLEKIEEVVRVHPKFSLAGGDTSQGGQPWSVSPPTTAMEIDKLLKIVFWLFFLAGIPAYFLSVLWLPIPSIIYCIIILAVVAQLCGWVLMIKVFIKNRLFISQQFSKYGKLLLLLSAIAFSIKLLLQSVSIHPALSQLSYSFRPIIIGYLHLVLLAVTSIFIIGYIVSFELIPVTKKLITGIFIFVAGIIINELLLMAQGIAALSYNSIPFINMLLLIAAIILLLGVAVLFVSQLKRNVADKIV